MLKIEKTEVVGWEAAIRGMRNPTNSLEQSDSDYRPILCKRCDNCMSYQLEQWGDCEQCEVEKQVESHNGFMVGPNDFELMTRLRNAGSGRRRFMRMLNVYLDITAPLYWWMEFKAYCAGGEFGDNEQDLINDGDLKHGAEKDSDSHDEQNSCKWFTLENFSCEHLISNEPIPTRVYSAKEMMEATVSNLNMFLWIYLQTKYKKYWWQMVQLLPSSFNQKHTVMLSYEALADMYMSCKNSKLDEWHMFCDWIRSLPYSELITGDKNDG